MKGIENQLEGGGSECLGPEADPVAGAESAEGSAVAIEWVFVVLQLLRRLRVGRCKPLAATG